MSYFLSKEYRRDLNTSNPLGTGGVLAQQTEVLLASMQRGNESFNAVYPRNLKYAISESLPQFQGYEQHDSQEFLIFFLDSLHEDVNKVIDKPYFKDPIPEYKDGKKLLLSDLARESWARHISRYFFSLSF